MMKKENVNEAMSTNGIIIDDVECITQKQAIQMTGVSYPTFKKKVQLFHIEVVKYQNRQLYRKQDIVTAIKKNWFAKWWV